MGKAKMRCCRKWAIKEKRCVGSCPHTLLIRSSPIYRGLVTAGLFGDFLTVMGLGGAETAATTTGACRLWVVDVETATHQVVDIVDVGAINIEKAGGIDD